MEAIVDTEGRPQKKGRQESVRLQVSNEIRLQNSIAIQLTHETLSSSAKKKEKGGCVEEKMKSREIEISWKLIKS